MEKVEEKYDNDVLHLFSNICRLLVYSFELHGDK